MFIFVNEALSVLLRAIHSAIARTPPHLLKEIILVDDNSSNGECPAPCPVRASQPPCRLLMFYRLSMAVPSLGCCLREERFTMVTTLEGSVHSCTLFTFWRGLVSPSFSLLAVNSLPQHPSAI